jgi:hypothetical protein
LFAKTANAIGLIPGLLQNWVEAQSYWVVLFAKTANAIGLIPGLLQNWVEAQSYWVVLFAKTANAIGLIPEKRDTGNLQGYYLVQLR